MTMRSRRFVLLAVVLVTLNAALWLAPQGLALRQIAAAALFGPKMVRATVLETNGAQWNVDRGIVQSNQSGQLTVREADGRTQAIPVAPGTTKVNVKPGLAPVAGIGAVKPGWHVLVTWPALGGPASSVLVEKRARLVAPPTT
jgi:hypothetical protein